MNDDLAGQTIADKLMEYGDACFSTICELSLHDKRATELHKHEFHHLVVCVSGMGTYVENDREFIIESPAVIFTPFGTFHKWSDWGDMKGYALGLSTDMIPQDYYFNFFSGNSPRVINMPRHALERVEPFLNKIKREWERSKSEREHIFSSCLNILFSEIIDYYPQIIVDVDPQEQLCKHFNNLLNTHWNFSHSSEFYAKKLGVTPDYLSKVLREKYGKSSQALIKSRILKEAKYLLTRTSRSVKEISFELGFNDPGYFSRFFRKSVNKAPKSYRKDFMKD